MAKIRKIHWQHRDDDGWCFSICNKYSIAPSLKSNTLEVWHLNKDKIGASTVFEKCKDIADEFDGIRYAEDKKCSQCLKVKPTIMFNKRPDSRSGRASKCKECMAERRKDIRREKMKNGFQTPNTKHCNHCNKTKSKADFSFSSYSNDGLRSLCKQCDVDRVKKYRDTKKGKESVKGVSERYHKNESNLKKIQAKRKISNLIRSGKIKRPSECSECKKQCKPDFHHDDYNKPFEVRALCRKCHMDWHKENGEGLL